MNGPVDPFRKRDLPDPEAMLAQIFSDVDAEQRAEELKESDRPPHRWLRVVAAAAAAAVIGGIGWTVMQPAVQQAGPGAPPAPTVPPPTPTPTPSPEWTVVPQPLPSMRTTTAPQRRTPAATPSATPTPTPTPTPAPTPTPTPGATPTSTPTAGEPTIDPPRVYVTEARRTGTSRPGFDIAVVNAEACPGSRGARIRGPWVDGPTVLSGEGMLTLGGTLVNRNTCIPMGLEVEVPTGGPTTVTIRVDMEYAAGTAEEINNGPHEAYATIE